jgi:serine/threonine-protein kinase PknK
VAGDLGIKGLTDPVQIGEGGFAVVYRARQSRFGREVAVKVLRSADLDPMARTRFERECLALGALSAHPGIVTVFDGGFTDRGEPYLMMEYYPGGSLAQRLQSIGPLQWQEVAGIGSSLARSLASAHEVEIIHRDVKPENIFVGSFGQVAIGDFGIARIAGGAVTRSGIVTASLLHAAPEIIDGGMPTPLSDVYSLGSTLYELVTGGAAFASDEISRLLTRIINEPVPDLCARGVHPAMAFAIERAMAKDPSQRWSDASEMAGALEAAGGPVAADPSAPAVTSVVNPTAVLPPPVPAGPPPPPPAPPSPRPSLPVPAGAVARPPVARRPAAHARTPVEDLMNWVTPPRTNGLAQASLVLSVVWLVGIGSVIGIILGFLGRAEIEQSSGTEKGLPVANAGIALGFLGLLGAAAVLA